MADLSQYDDVFQAAGNEWNVDPTLLKAVAGVESAGRPNAVSSKNAQGLMQIIPETQKYLGVTDPNDPVQSIYGAAKYLSEGLDKEGTPEGALLYYHGGPGWRQAYGPESKAYVPAVTAQYMALRPQQPDQSQAAQPASAPQGPVILGDSLASRQGLGGSGVVGASPGAVRAAVGAGVRGNAYQGRDVVLSSGASNAPGDMTNVEGQLQNLKDGNAGTVTLLGVGPGIEARNPGTNAALQALATKYGARFQPLPADQMGPDGVHPTAKGYRTLLAATTPKTATDASPAPAPAPAAPQGQGKAMASDDLPSWLPPAPSAGGGASAAPAAATGAVSGGLPSWLPPAPQASTPKQEATQGDLSGGYITPTGDYVPAQAIPGVTPSATAQPVAPPVPASVQPAHPAPNAFWAPGGRDIVANSGWVGRNLLAPAGDILGEAVGSVGQGFRGAQDVVAGAISPLSPTLGRDIAALPEAFPLAGRELGAPNALATPSVSDVRQAGRNLATEPWSKDPVTGELKPPPAPPAETPSPGATTSAAAKDVASGWYDRANEAGGTLTPEFTNKFIDSVAAQLPPTDVGKIVRGQSDVGNLVSRLQGLKDKPLTLAEVQDADEALGDLIDEHYDKINGLDKTGQKLLDIQRGLRQQILNAKPGDIEGGTEGFEALVQARAAWSQAMKMQDIERMQSRALGTQNPSTSIKTQFNNFVNNQAKLRGFSEDEIADLKRAADTGIVQGVAQRFGSRLVPYVAGAIGGSVGGIPGAVIGSVVGDVGAGALRSAATALQNRRVNRALGTIGRNVPQAYNPLSPGAVNQ